MRIVARGALRVAVALLFRVALHASLLLGGGLVRGVTVAAFRVGLEPFDLGEGRLIHVALAAFGTASFELVGRVAR